MKHLDLQLERLEERIAPCVIVCPGKSNKSNKSDKSHKSQKSHKSHKTGKSC